MIFRFGSYALDAERRELTRSGKRAALERQVFDILLYFLENRHRVVTRDDVLRAMLKNEDITSSQYANAVAKRNLQLKAGRLYTRIREPYFFSYVREELQRQYGALASWMQRVATTTRSTSSPAPPRRATSRR